MIYCYFKLCFEGLVCILSAKLFLSASGLADVFAQLGSCHQLHPTPSCGGMGRRNELAWRFTEMCLCVAKSPGLEADGDFKEQLHKSS